MSTYTQILYHLVFSTKNRTPALTSSNRKRLHTYLAGIIREKGSFVYETGGVEDHVHLLFHLHPSVALSDLVRVLKAQSSKAIRDNKWFPLFSGWGEGYGAFSCSYRNKEKIVNYIQNQEAHHKTIGFREEYLLFLKENGLEPRTGYEID